MAIVGFAHDLNLGGSLEDATHAFTHDPVIVHQCDANG